MRLVIIEKALRFNNTSTQLFRRALHYTTDQCAELLDRYTLLLPDHNRTIIAMPTKVLPITGMLAWASQLPLPQSSFPRYIPATARFDIMLAYMTERIEAHPLWWAASQLREKYADLDRPTLSDELWEHTPASTQYPACVLPSIVQGSACESYYLYSGVLPTFWAENYKETLPAYIEEWLDRWVATPNKFPDAKRAIWKLPPVKLVDPVSEPEPEPESDSEFPPESEPPAPPPPPTPEPVEEIPPAPQAPVVPNLPDTVSPEAPLSTLQFYLREQRESFMDIYRESQRNQGELLRLTAQVITEHHLKVMDRVIHAFQGKVVPTLQGVRRNLPPIPSATIVESAPTAYVEELTEPPIPAPVLKASAKILPIEQLATESEENLELLAVSLGIPGFIPNVSLRNRVLQILQDRYPKLAERQVHPKLLLAPGSALKWGTISYQRLRWIYALDLEFCQQNVRHLAPPEMTWVMFVRKSALEHVVKMVVWWYEKALAARITAGTKATKGTVATAATINQEDYRARAVALGVNETYAGMYRTFPSFGNKR